MEGNRVAAVTASTILGALEYATPISEYNSLVRVVESEDDDPRDRYNQLARQDQFQHNNFVDSQDTTPPPNINQSDHFLSTFRQGYHSSSSSFAYPVSTKNHPSDFLLSNHEAIESKEHTSRATIGGYKNLAMPNPLGIQEALMEADRQSKTPVSSLFRKVDSPTNVVISVNRRSKQKNAEEFPQESNEQLLQSSISPKRHFYR